MTRFLFKLIICVLFAGAAGLAYFAIRSGDPVYTLYEWISPARFHQYDGLIRSVATKHEIEPMLVKAIVWRESRFDPRKFGAAGERGLMQVSETAASEWAKENQIDNFQVEELFDPKKNLEAGSWYLQRALKHWEHEAEPTVICPRGIQRRRESRSTLGRRRRCRDFRELISSQHRFPGHAWLCGLDHAALRVLQTARPDVDR